MEDEETNRGAALQAENNRKIYRTLWYVLWFRAVKLKINIYSVMGSAINSKSMGQIQEVSPDGII